ncbi:MAG: hypothetical protein V8S34_01275 [Lawsonibacter sp.]
MKDRKKVLLWLLIVAVLLVASILTGNHAGQSETIQQTMRDAVLHNENRIDLLGWKAVNPGLISGFVVTAILLIAAAVLRICWIPRFKHVPAGASWCWRRSWAYLIAWRRHPLPG